MGSLRSVAPRPLVSEHDQGASLVELSRESRIFREPRYVTVAIRRYRVPETRGRPVPRRRSCTSLRRLGSSSQSHLAKIRIGHANVHMRHIPARRRRPQLGARAPHVVRGEGCECGGGASPVQLFGGGARSTSHNRKRTTGGRMPIPPKWRARPVTIRGLPTAWPSDRVIPGGGVRRLGGACSTYGGGHPARPEVRPRLR